MDFHYDPIPLPHRQALSPGESLRRAQAYYAFIRQRHSVRDFTDQPVDRAVIETALLAAGTAPSGANHQPWHFACVSDPAIKRRIRKAAEQEEREFYGGKAGDEWLNDLKKIGTDAQKPFLETAPWLIAIFAERYGIDEKGNRRKNYYMPESVGIATGFLINALHNAGLATLTHTPNPMKFLNEILGRPGNERPYILLVVGHPADNAMIPRAATVKKPLEQIASFLEPAAAE
ncbi:nitroreductase family protein [Parahaliea mediterranea]|uniref:Nitroreductase family protein n=1 Tax=Parahaliea mediterranea TaxID=651086 RepID=A0A939DCB8_9GAMM|nr:nitroreductase family protein [Parahaliea mediterranea]MBN7795296.1 nitroreductase family protein [Parahaliea mediterranea]